MPLKIAPFGEVQPISDVPTATIAPVEIDGSQSSISAVGASEAIFTEATVVSVSESAATFQVCCQEGHALVRQRGDEGEAWTCDMLDYSTGCRSGFTDARSVRPAGCTRWRCADCDFDLCSACHDRFEANREQPPQLPVFYRLMMKFGPPIACLLVVGAIITNVMINPKLSSSSSSSTTRSSSGGCFIPGTQVVMADGVSTKAIETLRLGDEILQGGPIDGLLEVWGGYPNVVRYNLSGVFITGSHGIFDPTDKLWKRVSDVSYATRLEPQHSSSDSSLEADTPAVVGHASGKNINEDSYERNSQRLWNVITRQHRVVLSGVGSQRVLAADYMEVDETPELLEESLAHLNRAQGGDTNYEGKGNAWWNEGLAAMPDDAIRRLRGCFPKGTRVLVSASDSVAPSIPVAPEATAYPIAIEDVPVGSFLLGGGRVEAKMTLAGDNEDLYEIGGVDVSAHHAVLDPHDGVWRHAKDVKHESKVLLPKRERVLYNLIVSQTHRMYMVGPSWTASAAKGAKAHFWADLLKLKREARLLSFNELQVLVATDFLESDEEEDFLEWNIRQLNSMGIEL